MFHAVICVALICLCCATVQGATVGIQPNIVFILADDLGYADIGYHGGAGQIKTPVLDKLAFDGVRLENYYVQPLCTPSRSALLSGRLTIHTGLQHMVIMPAAPSGLPLELPTLPQKLKAVGYDTHMIGKWHLGMYKKEYLPVNRGFDSFYGYYLGAEDYYTHSVCALFNDSSHYCGLDLHNGTTPDFNKNGSYSAHIFTQDAIRIINNQAKKSSPMFLYMAYQNVHQPQQVPAQYEEPYKFIKNDDRRILAGQVAVLDEAVGNITDALKAQGLWNNTILIFSSDNGGPVPSNTRFPGGVGCNYPLRGSKTTVWEGGTKVAGFVSGPLVENPKTVNHELIHISDWYPTIIGLAGGSIGNTTVDGYDQWAAISGKAPSAREEMLYNIDPLFPKYGLRKRGSPFDNRLQAALRIGEYKIVTGAPFLDGWYKPLSIEGRATHVEQITFSEFIAENDWSFYANFTSLQNIYLFNLTADPFERHDLSKEKPDVVDRMLVRLAEYADGAVPALHPPQQLKKADPSKHGGSWEPWQRAWTSKHFWESLLLFWFGKLF